MTAPGALTPGRLATAVAVAALLLQWLLLNHDFTVDGLHYAAAVERGGPLLHPNHLLYNALHFGMHRGIELLFGVAPRSIWTMQAVNMLGSAIAVGALAWIAARRAGPLIAAAVGLLLLAGFGFWTFSQEPEVYILPAACVAVSLALMERWPAIGALRAAWLALLAAAAVLLLQQYVFWYPVLLWLLWRRRSTLSTAGAAVLLTLPWLVPLLVYLLLGVANDALGTSAGILQWFLGYGYDAETVVGTYRAAPPFPIRVLSLALALGNLLFAYELALQPLWWPVALLAVVLLAVAAMPLLRAGRLRAAAPLLLFAGLNLLFTFWWEARNIEFLLPVWLAFVAILAVNADRLRRRPIIAATALLLLVNTATAAWPQRDWPLRYRMAAALAQSEQLGPQDRLITEELNTVVWLAYFHRSPVQFQLGAVNAAMHAELDTAHVQAQLQALLDSGVRVYTLELSEQGRLRALARRFPMLGRASSHGDIDAAVKALYRQFELQPVDRAAGAYRLHSATH